MTEGASFLDLLIATIAAQHRTIDRLAGAPPPSASGSNEAVAYVRQVANELKAAGEALLTAAEKLKQAGGDSSVEGKGYLPAANHAHQAGRRALEQAAELARA